MPEPQIAEKQPRKSKPKGKPRGRPFQKGQSGNPKGRPTDPERVEALELLKRFAPAVTQKALDLVLCDEPNPIVLNALIKKIFPENIKLETDNPLLVLIQKAKGTHAPDPH